MFTLEMGPWLRSVVRVKESRVSQLHPTLGHIVSAGSLFFFSVEKWGPNSLPQPAGLLLA